MKQEGIGKKYRAEITKFQMVVQWPLFRRFEGAELDDAAGSARAGSG